MAVAGRKPQPANLKLLKGRTPGRDSGDRKVRKPPSFVRKAPAPPSWLSKEAKAEWRRVVPELERLGLLKAGDRSGLANYCETWATFVAATKRVQSEGLTVEIAQGMVAHPAVAIARNAGKEIRSWCAEFGLTPSSEGRLNIPEAPSGEEDFD